MNHHKPILTRIIQTLGEGAEGSCRLVSTSEQSDYLVEKLHTVRPSTKQPPKNVVLHEAIALFGVLDGHSHFTMHGVSFDFPDSSQYCRIFSEFCDGGELAKVVDAMKVRRLLWLHTGTKYDPKSRSIVERGDANWTGLIHRDIHERNILLRHSNRQDDTSKYPDVILVDFGHCGFLDPEDLYVAQGRFPEHLAQSPPAVNECGAPYFTPPEHGQDDNRIPEPDGRYDYWQLARLMTLVAGWETPIKTSKGWMAMMRRMNYSDALIAAIARMHDPEPSMRPTDRDIARKLPHWQALRDEHIRLEEEKGVSMVFSVSDIGIKSCQHEMEGVEYHSQLPSTGGGGTPHGRRARDGNLTPSETHRGGPPRGKRPAQTSADSVRLQRKAFNGRQPLPGGARRTRWEPEINLDPDFGLRKPSCMGEFGA